MIIHHNYYEQTMLMKASLNQCCSISDSKHLWCSGSSSSSSTDTTITNINDASGGSRFNLSSFITNLCHEYSSSSGVDVSACISNAGSPQSLMTSGTSGGDGGGSGLKLKWLMNGTTVVSYLNQYELLHMCASSGTIIVQYKHDII